MIIFICNSHWPPWRSGCLDGFCTHVSRVRNSGIAWFFFFVFFFVIFYLFVFFLCFFVIIITVQICKFNITVSTQFLLLYYSLWCPGLQRLQRFDFHKWFWQELIFGMTTMAFELGAKPRPQRVNLDVLKRHQNTLYPHLYFLIKELQMKHDRQEICWMTCQVW